MSSENGQAQMLKGVLEMCILQILDSHEAYTSEMLERLKDAKLIVVEGTLYPLLTRLKNAGWLTYRWEESTSGPPRKYYSITTEGKQKLNQLTSSWNELQQAVNQLTTKK
jgi:PadR family transcriptional regulator PadR